MLVGSSGSVGVVLCHSCSEGNAAFVFVWCSWCACSGLRYFGKLRLSLRERKEPPDRVRVAGAQCWECRRSVGGVGSDGFLFRCALVGVVTGLQVFDV